MSEAVTEELILAIQATGVSEATGQMDALVASTDRLTAATDRASAAFSGEGAAAGRGAAGGAAVAGSKGLVGSLTSLKNMAVVGIGVESIKGLINFQAQMELLHTQTGASQDEVTNMSKSVLGLSKSLGSDPQGLAEALYHIESTGLRGGKAIDALTIAAKASKMGMADLTDTTTGMLAVNVAGFSGIKNLAQAMGALNAVVGAGDMTMQDLNEALGTGILATFKAAGLQVKDFGAGMAVLGDNNIRGAAAATDLGMALRKLFHEAGPARAKTAELGLGAGQLAEDLRKPNGLLVALKDLEAHMKGLSPAQQNDAVGTIFGAKSSQGILTLLNQMGRLEEKYGAVQKGATSFDANWKSTTETLKQFVASIKANVLVTLIELGEKLAAVVGWFRKNKWAVEVLKDSLIVLATYWAVSKVVAFASGLMGVARALGMAGGASTLAAGEMAASLSTLALFAAGFVAVALAVEAVSHALGKGSFVNNLKDALGGQSWIGKSEHEFDHIASGHLNALKQLEAARHAHPHTAAMMRARDHGRSPFTGQPIHAAVVPAGGAFGNMNLYAHTPVKIDLNGKEIAKAVVKAGLEGQSGK